jgi:hypothetical protein
VLANIAMKFMAVKKIFTDKKCHFIVGFLFMALAVYRAMSIFKPLIL